MKLSIKNVRIALLAAACFSSFVVATVSKAQVAGNSNSPNETQDLNRRAALAEILQIQGAEQDAYEAFGHVSVEDLDKKIKLGQDFLRKYPESKHAEGVDVELTNAYYAKQDWQNFYASADRTLALKPDDVDVLVTVGWVIPHLYNRQDPNAESLLDKAESYEKRAIPAISTMPQPAGVKEAQFSEFRVQKLNQAHSALGLFYFRRRDYENSVKELQQATQNTATPDQADLFVLGTSLEKLSRYADAAESFDRCGQIAGDLQQQCKQRAAAAKQLGA
jgi:tetratricopeptide (TPR) repeat protein